MQFASKTTSMVRPRLQNIFRRSIASFPISQFSTLWDFPQKYHVHRASTRMLSTNLDPEQKGARLNNSLEFCMSRVRENQPELFQTIAHLPSDQQPLSFAVHAIFSEIRQIPRQTKSPEMGLMRLTWWRSAIESVANHFAHQQAVLEDPSQANVPYEIPPENPVIHLLSNALHSSGLGFDFAVLLDAISVEEKWLANEPYAELPSLIADIDSRHGELLATLVSVGAHASTNAEELMPLHPDITRACIHLGRAQGLLELLRLVPHAGELGHVRVPADMLWFEGLVADDLARVHPEMLATTNRQFDADLSKYLRTVAGAPPAEDLGERSLDLSLALMRRQQGMPLRDTDKELLNLNPDGTPRAAAPQPAYVPYAPVRDERGAAARPAVLTNEFVRKQLALVAARLGNIAEQALDQAAEHALRVPRPLRRYLLATVPLRAQLSRLRAAGHDVYEPSLQQPSPREMLGMQVALATKKLLGRV